MLIDQEITTESDNRDALRRAEGTEKKMLVQIVSDSYTGIHNLSVSTNVILLSLSAYNVINAVKICRCANKFSGTCIHVSVHVCIHACVYACVYDLMHVCMYI